MPWAGWRKPEDGSKVGITCHSLGGGHRDQTGFAASFVLPREELLVPASRSVNLDSNHQRPEVGEVWQSHTSLRKGVMWGECYEVFGILQKVTPVEIPASMSRDRRA